MRSKTIGNVVAALNTGGATADYTSIASWISSIADTDNETGTVITQFAAFSENPALNVSNTGSWIYLLTADSTTNFDAATYSRGTACARVSASGTVVSVSTSGWIVEKIAISGSAGSFNGVVHINTSAAFTLRRCFVRTSGSGEDIFSTGGGTHTVDNCMCTSSTGNGEYCIAINGGNGTLNVYQTSTGWNSGSWNTSYYNGTLGLYGHVAQGAQNGNADQGGTITGNYNVSNLGTVGANSLNNQTGVFTSATSTSEDFSLTSSTTYAIVNRSGFPSDTDTDIVGTTRPSTGADSGVWQTPSAPSGRRIFLMQEA